MAIILRSQKGSPLTNNEVDGNFTDLDGRVSAAKSTADAAQPKVAGKGLSTNDYDATEKAKVAAAIPSSQKGVASGVATLGADAKLPANQLPNTDSMVEGPTNQYFSTARVRATVLAGLSAVTNAAISAADSVLSAFGKLQAQIDYRALKGANSDITSLAGLTTPLSVAQGGLGVTSVPVAFTRLRDSQALTYAEATAERLRMKTFEPINFVVDIDDATVSQIRGPGYVTSNTLGTKPPGFAFGILNTIMTTGGVLSQTFEPLSGLAGVTFPLYRRTGLGATAGRWGPWRLVIDSDSALSDPGSGGILSRTVVSGIALTKYADGRNIANGVFQPTSVSVPINSIQSVAIPLPFSIGTDDLLSSANINVQPSITYDHYGVVSAFITAGGTTLNVIIRNGATEQTFSIRGILMGHWK